jgi:hypothetical protein
MWPRIYRRSRYLVTSLALLSPAISIRPDQHFETCSRRNGHNFSDIY